jgi:hypothetical protein
MLQQEESLASEGNKSWNSWNINADVAAKVTSRENTRLHSAIVEL